MLRMHHGSISYTLHFWCKTKFQIGLVSLIYYSFAILFPHYDNENLFQCDENYKIIMEEIFMILIYFYLF